MAGEPRSATERVWSALPGQARHQLEQGLSPTDLQTLLIDVQRTRALRVDGPRLVARWQEDRFCRPSGTDPRRRAATEAALWRLLPAHVAGVTLSPLTPLGSCGALGGTHQSRIVSTVRSSEVVSDPTNVLALEAAARRRGVGAAVHLAACARVVRAQRFADPAASAHFELFALVSSARDAGSAQTEAELLVAHLGYWATVLEALIGSAARIDYTVIDGHAVGERIADTYGLPWRTSGWSRIRAVRRASDTTGRPASRSWWRPTTARWNWATAASPTGRRSC